MDLERFLTEATRLPGVPGYEGGVNGYIEEAFRPLADEVRIDVMENVIARLGSEGPKVMIAAHQDEIGLMVTKIEDDGCVRFWRNGGVDPRILPGMEVEIQGPQGPVYGVIGAKPPHLLSAEDRKSAVKFENLYIDVGYGREEAQRRVRQGDPIVMLAPPVKLAGDCMASKTMDDRASVAAMLEAAELLGRMRTRAQVHFVASTQEEIGSKGAQTAAYALHPDFAIAIDVTHGEGPGTGKWEAFPLDKVVLACGPNIHPALQKIAEEVAQRNRIDYAMEVCGGHTGTDAWNIQVARGGIPTILVSIPLRYMHTTVETLKLDTVREAGRLMALFIDEVQRRWEDIKWY